MVQDNVAGVGSRLPAASFARTANVCGPSVSGPNTAGDAQALKGPAYMLHSNVPPASLAVKEKVALVLLVGELGLVTMVVSGGTVSIVQENVAGVASRLPTASFARTANVWGP